MLTRGVNSLAPRVGSRAAAEDLLQAAFVRGLERGGDWLDSESAVAWFYGLLRNASTDFSRRRVAQRRAVNRHSAEARLTAELEAAVEAAVCECVRGLIPTLKPGYADMLRAVEMDGRGRSLAPSTAGAEGPARGGMRHLHGARVPRLPCGG